MVILEKWKEPKWFSENSLLAEIDWASFGLSSLHMVEAEKGRIDESNKIVVWWQESWLFSQMSSKCQTLTTHDTH